MTAVGNSTPRGGAEATDQAVLALVRTSLGLWRVDAAVRRSDDGRIVIEAPGLDVEIGRAPSELPFRWLIETAGRQRPASSVAGLLRNLRMLLEPQFRPARARIASFTPPPAAS